MQLFQNWVTLLIITDYSNNKKAVGSLLKYKYAEKVFLIINLLKLYKKGIEN